MFNSQDINKEIIELRRHLHMYPEEGFSEYNTSAYIINYLRTLNYDLITDVAKTGVIAILKGKVGNESIAVRADMDCLQVNEETGVSYSSKTQGLMHACGHDGHVSSLLGLAKYLKLSDKKFNCNIIFIFQPAEEGPGGAELIVKSKILNNFNIKAILGMHIFPEIEEGRIGCCIGPITARNGEIDIEINGKSSHGALPHKGIDSIVISSQILQQIQTIVSRRIDPLDSVVVTFGKIYGGNVRNIIAGQTTLEGTIRSFSSETYGFIKQNILSICRGAEIQNSCNILLNIRDMYPEVYNDIKLFNILLKAVDKDKFDIIKPLMIAEDFSYYREIAPELFFLLGSRNEKLGFTNPLHSPKFNFNESILINAVNIFSNIINLLDK